MNKKKLLISCTLILSASPILWAQILKTNIAAMKRSIDSVVMRGIKKKNYPECLIVIVQNVHTLLSICHDHHFALTRRKTQQCFTPSMGHLSNGSGNLFPIAESYLFTYTKSTLSQI